MGFLTIIKTTRITRLYRSRQTKNQESPISMLSLTILSLLSLSLAHPISLSPSKCVDPHTGETPFGIRQTHPGNMAEWKVGSWQSVGWTIIPDAERGWPTGTVNVKVVQRAPNGSPVKTVDLGTVNAGSGFITKSVIAPVDLSLVKTELCMSPHYECQYQAEFHVDLYNDGVTQVCAGDALLIVE